MFRPLTPLVDYIVDYDYISTVLCINTDKPEMNCNGQCYLKNELAKLSQEEQKKDSIKQICSSSFSILYFDLNTNNVFIQTPWANTDVVLDCYSNLYASLFNDQIFRPPFI